jgi:hypothetical protein
MWKQNLASLTFSFAVKRPTIEGGLNDAGTITFGGLSEISFLTSMVTTRIVKSNISNDIPHDNAIPADPGQYFMTVDDIVYGSLQSNRLHNISDASGIANLTYAPIGGTPALLDTGNSGMILPYYHVDAINALFSPPADADYQVECDAIPPAVGFRIQGQKFYLEQRDLVYRASDGRCRSYIRGTDETFVLGLEFFWNTVVVFDIGSGVIQVAARGDY